MAPLLLAILVPSLLGGVILALLLRSRRWSSGLPVPGRLAPPSPGVINMASIRIEGIGGLGMVAMALTVSIFEPRIRTAMAIAFVLGIALAAVLIALRRRNGPLTSDSQDPGAHAMLHLDAGPASRRPARSPRSNGNQALQAGLSARVRLTAAR
jgi:hypothetical protein